MQNDVTEKYWSRFSETNQRPYLSSGKRCNGYIPAGADGRPDAGPRAGLMLWLQKAAGEPWLWSITPWGLGPYLEKCGWNSDPKQQDAHKYGVEYFAMAVKPENGK